MSGFVRSMFSPTRKLMQRFGAADNREVYLDICYLGNPPVEDENGYLDGETEESLPFEFQRHRLDENVLTEEEQ